MKRLKVYIVDDEETAIEGLTELVEETPILHLTGTTTDPFEALAYVQKNDVALLFVDINMEGMSGLELTKLIDNKVILTTAHESYALESYGYENVIGYLVKPITHEKFQLAIRKALNNSIILKDDPMPQGDDPFGLFIARTIKGEKEILYSSIDYVKAEGDYSAIFHGKDKDIVSVPLKDLEVRFPSLLFTRIHKSYIINKRRVKSARFDKVVLDGNVTIPIGRTYKFSKDDGQ